MKKPVYIIALFVISIITYSQTGSFDTYMNPVIPGDHPDCTLTKIGNHYYTTGSSFNVTPVIYHSTDLVHWEAIAQPVSASWTGYGDSPGGGCWGGHMVLYNGEYWDYFSKGFEMYFVKAPSPEGPWSMPVKVNNPPQLSYGLGYDNSLFIDDDNKWYLVVKNGQPNGGIVELGDDGQPTGVVYDLNWLNPEPDYPYSWAEGPVMWKYHGYYYYSFARDLSGGQKVMRSNTLTADESSWEFLGDFFNENDPLKSGSLFTSPNHASPVITLEDSTFWIIHPVYAKGEWKGQGRQGLLNQVRYDTAGKPTADYPVNKSFAAPALKSSGIPWMVPHSDFFNSDQLNPEWSFLGYTGLTKQSLSERPGWLRLSPKNRFEANTIIKNDGEHNYSLITHIEYTPSRTSDAAGLWIFRGDETMFVKLVSTADEEGNKIIAYSFNDTKYIEENIYGENVFLKLVRNGHKISGYVSGDSYNWTKIGEDFDISEIDSYSDFSTFTGTRQGLYVSGDAAAYFDYYIYRDAYTPILAECPANQYGTKLLNNATKPNSLGNINNNDWALYAGIEFGNDEYSKTPDSLFITASSANSGGTVEVWLDSLDSANKIAECQITGTESWSTYETFAAAVSGDVSGNHDVYFRFKGDGEDELFRLKTITFTSEIDSTVSVNKNESAKPGKFELYQNYPNPFNPTTIIKYTIPMVETLHATSVRLKIYDILGKEVAVLVDEQQQAGSYKVMFDASKLSSGIYLYKMEAGSFSQTKKLLLLK